MANVVVRDWPPRSDWMLERTGRRMFVLEMDEYEFANLRWLMDVIYSRDHLKEPVPNLDNGDWCGQIRHALKAVDTNWEPNGGRR